MTAVARTIESDVGVPSHLARAFAKLPSADATVMLLEKLASAPPDFAAVPANRLLGLYGAGSLGRLARGFLTAVGRDFVVVIDRNARELALDPQWSDIRMVHPDDLTPSEKNGLRVAVSIVTSPYVPIEASLFELGYPDVVPFYDLAESFRDLHPLSNGWFASPLKPTARANTGKVLAQWHDDISRAHHLQFLAWRRLREEWNFPGAPVTTDDRYFIPEVTGILHDHEFLLDAGAHHGQVSQAFIKQTGGRLQHIAVVEPDVWNRTALKHNLRTWVPDQSSVTIYDCALAAEESEAQFHEGLGYASQLSPTGGTRVTTYPLDALDLSPSFIKLHLEGGELAALQGAKRTLLQNRPIVAATVYHNDDGIWRTPLWLMETLDNYRFLFRLHSWCGTGAVVYAIPDERTAS
jgi:FkbM family methyltransferase